MPGELLLVLAMLSVGVAGPGNGASAQAGDDVWTTPINLSHSGAASAPVVIAVPGGGLRVLWWDRFDGLTVADGSLPALGMGGAAAGGGQDETWSEPVPVPILLPTPVITGAAESSGPVAVEVMPAIVADATGQAHAFWLGPPDQETGNRALLHSRFAPDAASWSTPVTLTPGAVAFYASGDTSGAMHLAYIQTLNSPSSPAGVYYRRFDQQRARWTAPAALYQ